MDAIQQVFVDGSDAVVNGRIGNSFTWATNLPRIDRRSLPGQHRVGSMGHMVAGVVGAAQAQNSKAVAIVGDESV